MSKKSKVVVAVAAIVLNTIAAISLHIFFYERFMPYRWSRSVSSISAIVDFLIFLFLITSVRVTKRVARVQDSNVR